VKAGSRKVNPPKRRWEAGAEPHPQAPGWARQVTFNANGILITTVVPSSSYVYLAHCSFISTPPPPPPKTGFTSKPPSHLPFRLRAFT